MRAAVLGLWGLVVCGASGCLLFTDNVNVPPAVTIDGPEKVRRGPKHMFSAKLQDSEPNVTFDWRWAETCPANIEAAVASGTSFGTGAQIKVAFEEGTAEQVCVWVVARDERGARSVTTRLVEVTAPVLLVKGPPQDELESDKPATFSASYVGEPATAAEFFFGVSILGCSDARVQAMNRLSNATAAAAGTAPILSPGPATYEERAPRKAFCVAVLARDEHKVQAWGEGEFGAPKGSAPTIRLVAPSQSASEPLPLYSFVRLAAGGGYKPGESVTFEWNVTGPGGAAVTPLKCESPLLPPNLEFCLEVPAGGGYLAKLTVVDGPSRIEVPPLALQVEDRPPCIRKTSPSFNPTPRVVQLYDQSQTFNVLEVADDGDPLPPPNHPWQSGFTWYIRRLGEPDFRRLVHATYRELVIAAREYQPGDRLEVRVEYADRVGLADPSKRSLAHCPPSQALCSVSSDATCNQRVTWLLEYL